MKSKKIRSNQKQVFELKQEQIKRIAVAIQQQQPQPQQVVYRKLTPFEQELDYEISKLKKWTRQ